MNDDELTNKFFLESDSDQLRKIYLWARARYAAPWAVFFAVLLRVAASVGPHVRLPGVIGGQASLNLLCAFVAPSGGGKGISDKVGRLAWPVPILELPIGSGEGIAETFTLRGKESEDNERITAAIFNCSEIDILTGLESRQGSTILGTLKAFAMGEQFGSTNASKANSRNVPAHSYRGCLSVGAQPGHTGVIFNDTTGGTPQRLLWALTIDPDMPATVTPDPDPLDTTMPAWKPGADGVVEIVYGHDEITETIISSHLARQRGEADALDGHAMLTRCKVAAVLAIMHHRMVVSELDWRLSEQVMRVSDSTRDWILSEAKRAQRAKVRERAQARAYGENIVADSKVERAAKGILAKVANTSEPMSSGEIRRSLRSDLRPEFAPALDLLVGRNEVHVSDDGQVVHVDTLSTYQNPSSGHVDTVVHVDTAATVTELDSRRSSDFHQPKLSCAKWFDNYVIQLRAVGETTFTSFAVKAEASAEGYSENLLHQAIAAHPDVVLLERKGGNAVWSITGEPTGYQSVLSWFNDWLDALPANVVEVDKAALKQDCESAGHSWESLRRDVVQRCPRIESIKNGRNTVWKITTASAEDGAAS